MMNLLTNKVLFKLTLSENFRINGKVNDFESLFLVKWQELHYSSETYM